MTETITDDMNDDVDTVPLAEALLRGAAAHPGRDCIVFVDDRVTYAELTERATAVGRSLIGLGVERGDHVGILMANCLDYTDVLFGASLIGAIPVLYNARFKAREIAHVTTDAGVKVVVTNDIIEQHTDYVELLDCAGIHDAPTVEAAVFLGSGSRPGFLDRATFVAAGDEVSDQAVLERHEQTAVEDTALMFYTSGTTAMPKGCPLDHIVLPHAGIVGESHVDQSPIGRIHRLKAPFSAFTTHVFRRIMW